ncbi:Na/Pi cotransporter family protein [Campylobacter coli]|uniref:Na/Pi cotransporter family protein n=1 Tax=Campylobacter coli TaxID=195 RepID=A0A5T1UTM2_CAMCO|nr:Na/Pi cotransporter family protein [Campylobacter coli]EAJ2014269.1 Na/Pi cotransporter family protein [Campylobacter coli]EAJ8944076.1 Na/Pi cotransporter family protein [Campylobacter coli]EAK2344977.1 Na/Pi cotransporter family protein [Campylobacter coli]EAL0928552.1 Na/Pi cotransporter family protein [Campylobacter coli]
MNLKSLEAKVQERKNFLKYLKMTFWGIFTLVLIFALIRFSELANLLAGVAILLIGMTNLSLGFKSFSGGLLEKILTHSTNTKLKSILFGAISTLIMQSSTLVSIISLSFLSAGLISLVAGVGIIFGANLGNTASSWLIVWLTRVNISILAIPLLVIGVLFFFQKDNMIKSFGNIFIGIGFFFLGVDYIKNGFNEFQDAIDLSYFDFTGFKGVLIFVGLGALLTGIIQSSTATIAIIVAALLTGQISFENSLAATLGTSVGGVVTAVLASLSTNVEGKKLAFANCIFNFTIAIIIILIFPYFIDFLNGMAKILNIENLALKMALFHTLFNLLGIFIFVLFIPQLVNFLNKIVKAPKDKNKDRPLYLEPSLLKFSDTAIEALQKESEHLYDNAYAIIAHAIGLSRKDIQSNKSFEEILQNKKWFSKNVDLDYLYQARIKVLFEAIIDFSTKAQIHIDDELKNHRIFTFKIAAKNLTEATKNLKLVQENIKKYSNCGNKDLALEYNKIRSNLGELLRSIQELRSVDDEKVYLIIKNLQKGKEILKEIDGLTLNNVEHLILVRKITTAEGISIINDTSFIAKIAKDLIDAVEIIFAREKVLWDDIN